MHLFNVFPFRRSHHCLVFLKSGKDGYVPLLHIDLSSYHTRTDQGVQISFCSHTNQIFNTRYGSGHGLGYNGMSV